MKTKEKLYISALVMGLFNQLGAHIGNSSSIAQPAKKCCRQVRAWSWLQQSHSRKVAAWILIVRDFLVSNLVLVTWKEEEEDEINERSSQAAVSPLTHAFFLLSSLPELQYNAQYVHL